MRLCGSVNAIHKLSRQEVTQILHTVRSCVYIVVASFSMVAEAVGVLHAQIQALLTQKNHVNKTANFQQHNTLEQLLHLQGLWTRAPTGR